MPNVNKVKLLSERTSGAPPVIFDLEPFLKIHLYCNTQLRSRNSLCCVVILVGCFGSQNRQRGQMAFVDMCNCCKIYLRCATCVSCFQLQLAVSSVTLVLLVVEAVLIVLD